MESIDDALATSDHINANYSSKLHDNSAFTPTTQISTFSADEVRNIIEPSL